MLNLNHLQMGVQEAYIVPRTDRSFVISETWLR